MLVSLIVISKGYPVQHILGKSLIFLGSEAILGAFNGLCGPHRARTRPNADDVVIGIAKLPVRDTVVDILPRVKAIGKIFASMIPNLHIGMFLKDDDFPAIFLRTLSAQCPSKGCKYAHLNSLYQRTAKGHSLMDVKLHPT